MTHFPNILLCLAAIARPDPNNIPSGLGSAALGSVLAVYAWFPRGRLPRWPDWCMTRSCFTGAWGVFVGVVGFASLFGLSEGTGGDRLVWFGLCVRFPDGSVGLCVVPGRRAGLGVCLGAGSRARACDGLADDWRNAVFG